MAMLEFWSREPGSSPHDGLPLPWIAQRYAIANGRVYTVGINATVRHAVRTLEKEGHIRTGYGLVPSVRGRRRRMMLVGSPGSGNLVPAPGVYSRKAIPDRLEKRSFLLDNGCARCHEKAGVGELAALAVGLPIGDTCVGCWFERKGFTEEEAMEVLVNAYEGTSFGPDFWESLHERARGL